MKWRKRSMNHVVISERPLYGIFLDEEEWRRNCSSVKPSSEEVDVKVDANEVAD